MVETQPVSFLPQNQVLEPRDTCNKAMELENGRTFARICIRYAFWLYHLDLGLRHVRLILISFIFRDFDFEPDEFGLFARDW